MHPHAAGSTVHKPFWLHTVLLLPPKLTIAALFISYALWLIKTLDLRSSHVLAVNKERSVAGHCHQQDIVCWHAGKGSTADSCEAASGSFKDCLRWRQPEASCPTAGGC